MWSMVGSRHTAHRCKQMISSDTRSSSILATLRKFPAFNAIMALNFWGGIALSFMEFCDFISYMTDKSLVFDSRDLPVGQDSVTRHLARLGLFLLVSLVSSYLRGIKSFSVRTLLGIMTLCAILAAVKANWGLLLCMAVLSVPFVLTYRMMVTRSANQ
jgi:hypothetical protein